MDAGPYIGETAEHGLPQSQIAQGVRRLERVVVELALVEDPAHAGPDQEITLRQELVPQLLHLVDLGEETVAPEIEAPAIAQDGTADTTDHLVGLEDHRVLPPFRQLVGGSEPSRAGARDHSRR